jgi:hypothetical protein
VVNIHLLNTVTMYPYKHIPNTSSLSSSPCCQLQAGLEVDINKDRQERIDQLRKGNTTSFRMNKPRAQRRPPVGGKWSASEDSQLKVIVAEHGPKNWKKIADILGETRTDVQCLHRWNKVRAGGLSMS